MAGAETAGAGASPAGAGTSPALPAGALEATPRRSERLVYWALVLCTALSVATTTAIVVSLLGPTISFFDRVPIGDFLTGTEWSPQFAEEQAEFGVLPIVVGTLNVTLWALLVAVPAGLGTAIYLSEYASRRVRRTLKPAIEVLAGIPTVAFGFFALYFVTPLLRDNWPGFLGEQPGIFNAGSAGIAIGVLIIPIVASISEDAMSAVPAGLREGAFALGATRMRVALRVVVPAALSGIVASIVLGISRAVGETMVVLIAAGATANLTMSPVEPIEAMTAYIGRTATGDIATGTIEYDTIFAVGTLLFVMTFVMNMVSIRLVRRYREVYE